MNVTLKPNGIDGTVTVLAGAPSAAEGGKVLGSFSVSADDPKSITTKIVALKGLKKFKGKQPLFFVFSSPQEGVSVCDLYNFSF